jgi:hypothetical protein
MVSAQSVNAQLSKKGFEYRVENLIPSPSDTSENDPNDPFVNYVKWKNSDDFYGQKNMHLDYFSGRSLLNIADSYLKADQKITVIKVVKDPGNERISSINEALIP